MRPYLDAHAPKLSERVQMRVTYTFYSFLSSSLTPYSSLLKCDSDNSFDNTSESHKIKLSFHSEAVRIKEFFLCAILARTQTQTQICKVAWYERAMWSRISFLPQKVGTNTTACPQWPTCKKGRSPGLCWGRPWQMPQPSQRVVVV